MEFYSIPPLQHNSIIPHSLQYFLPHIILLIFPLYNTYSSLIVFSLSPTHLLSTFYDILLLSYCPIIIFYSSLSHPLLTQLHPPNKDLSSDATHTALRTFNHATRSGIFMRARDRSEVHFNEGTQQTAE